MLAPGLDTLRLTLHVLAASIWVGGQIALADLVGPSRAFGAEAPRVLARAFARLAWPAFAVLVLTGFWNVSTFHWADQSDAWKTVLIVKIVVVAAAGLGAFLHGRATSRTAIAVWGSVGGLASVAALVLGVLLAGG
jgi:putative copper export protein